MSNKLHRIAPLLIVLGSAVSAFAQDSELDARLTGYPQGAKVAVQTPSVSGAWFLLAGLGLVAIGPMFLNARRTHLD